MLARWLAAGSENAFRSYMSDECARECGVALNPCSIRT